MLARAQENAAPPSVGVFKGLPSDLCAARDGMGSGALSVARKWVRLARALTAGAARVRWVRMARALWSVVTDSYVSSGVLVSRDGALVVVMHADGKEE